MNDGKISFVRADHISSEWTREDRISERQYRKGYMHGYGQAMDDLLEALTNGKFPRHKEAWNHIARFYDTALRKWGDSPCKGVQVPPHAPPVTSWVIVREQTFDRDGRRCVWCGSSSNLECDHILPVKDGGTSDLDNLRTLCAKCHQNREHIERIMSSRTMTMHVGGEFHHLLQCVLDRYEISVDGGVRFYFPRNNCCDMSGAIQVAKSLSPSVSQVETFVDGNPDTIYVYQDGDWQSFHL